MEDEDQAIKRKEGMIHGVQAEMARDVNMSRRPTEEEIRDDVVQITGIEVFRNGNQVSKVREADSILSQMYGKSANL